MTMLLQGAGLQTAASTPPATGLLLDLEADTLTAGAVATWADQSGNGHDFTQATGAAQPIAQLLGGYMFVVPDGVNDWMDGGQFADNLASFTIVLVSIYPIGSGVTLNKQDVNADWEYNGWEVGNSGDVQLTQQPPGGDYSQFNQEQNIGLVIGDKHVFTIEKVSNTELNIYLDGVFDNKFGSGNQVGPVITSFATTESVKLWVEGGVNGPDNNGYSTEPLAAVRMYSPALDATTRAAAEAELAARYGITL